LVLIYAGFRLTCWLRRGRLDDASAEERAAASVDLGRFQDLDRSFTLTLVAVALMHIVLVHGRMSCAKTAEPIEMPLPGGRLTWAPEKEPSTRWDPDLSHGKGSL